MAGKKSKGNNTVLKKKVKLIGEMVKILNYSPHENYCASTGLKLPRNGMVVRLDGQYFLNRKVAEAFERARLQSA